MNLAVNPARRRLGTLAVALALLLVLSAEGWAQVLGGRPALVQVDAAVIEPLKQTTPVLGRLVARQAGPVAARVRGAVAELHVDVGDRVAAGQVIAVLINDRLEAERDRAAAVLDQRNAQVATAKTEVEKKRQELGRLEELRRSAAFSKARYDDMVKDVAMVEGELAETEAQSRQAQAQLNLANYELRNSVIWAPYGGVVSALHTEVGAYVNVGGNVVTLINDAVLEIEAEVPTERLAGLFPGTPIDVRLDDGTRHSATVRAVVPEENALTRTRVVRFSPQFGQIQKALASNQSVTVLIPIGEEREVVTVHKDAVISSGAGAIVYVVEADTAQMRRVQLGEATGNRFVVRSGLTPGDMTVVRGNERLRPGQRVRVSQGGGA